MEWTRGPIIGRGSSALVSLATASTGELFAVKSTNISSASFLQKEKQIISQLSSPYIVKCLGSDITSYNENYNIFLEYVPGGTLSELIKTQGGSLNETDIQFYAHQMLQGLNYIHQQGLVHCDIKGQNMLLSNTGLKIADFGCAEYGTKTSGFAGTPAYMAPEVARGEEQGFPADIWAMGCTIIEMATGLNPWPEMQEPASALYRIGYGNESPEIPSWFSGNCKNFVAKCLVKDPRERCTAAELLQHPFMKCVVEIKRSPTSVMDQDVWDVLEVSDSSNVMGIASSFLESPAIRIGDLIGDFESNSGFSDWTEEGEWITVRSDEVEEILGEADDEMDFDAVEDSVDLSTIGEEIDQFLDTIEGSLFDRYIDENIIVGYGHSSEFVSDIVDLEIKDFMNVLMELFVHQIRISLLCFINLSLDTIIHSTIFYCSFFFCPLLCYYCCLFFCLDNGIKLVIGRTNFRRRGELYTLCALCTV